MTAENNIGVFIGSHGEEMKIGSRLLHKLEANPIHGVIHRVAHPKAVALGQRYLGTGSDAMQIMSRYPGTPNGDPEQQAAYANLKWIQERNPSVILDVHETRIFGSYAGVGERVTKAALASAIYLGYNRILVEKIPFYEAVPNSALLESSLAENDEINTAQKLYQDLQELAAQDLNKLHYTNDHTLFYKKVDVMTKDTDIQLLQNLEEIPVEPFFSPLELSIKQRVSIGLPKKAHLVYGTWGHNNMSRKRPEKFGYTKDAVPRSECFGDILVETAPPQETNDGFLIFEGKN